MAIIDQIKRLTENRFLSMYQVDGHNSKGHVSHYMVASRADGIEKLQISTGKNKADAVIIYAVLKDDPQKVVLVRQYRYAVNDWVYEMPAGLCDEGETYRQAAARELHEETGLVFEPVDADEMYEAPRYTTIGMTDESVATVFGYATGTISDKYLEASEELQVVIADKEECKRVLKEERVSLNCAYSLSHFIHDETPFGFLH